MLSWSLRTVLTCLSLACPPVQSGTWAEASWVPQVGGELWWEFFRISPTLTLEWGT